ncbi:Uncharacterized protein ChrSV_1106 [Chromobacterium vaccinii]|nr:Uncharacterized protein ChrSW_1106 [Chromobacterium vaccinii]QND88564.1 Uncharacterized protein ChrSV_1106 [Chromobacterium vaccinii]
MRPPKASAPSGQAGYGGAADDNAARQRAAFLEPLNAPRTPRIISAVSSGSIS